MTKAEFLMELFSCFNKKAIDYFVVGEYSNLPNNSCDGDINIYIAPEHYNNGTDILEKIRRKNEIVLASFYRNPYESYVRLLTFEWGIQINLQNSFLHKCNPYYEAKYLNDNILLYNSIIKVLDINVGYYVVFLKKLIHTGQIKDKYVTGFIKEFANNPKRHKEIEACMGTHTLELFNKFQTKEEIIAHTRELRSCMIKHIHSRSYLKKICTIVINLRRIFSPPGYVIAVLGTDGSGKSTIIDGITPILNEGFHHGVEYNHLRPNAIPDLGVLLGKKEKQAAAVVNTEPHALKQSGLLVSLLRWGYYMLDYTFGYLKVVWPQIHTKSKVYIFDRYYYDYYVDQKRSRTSLPRWIIRIGDFFVPKPDLIICLGGDPRKIYARKPETSLEEVVRQTETLNAFCVDRKSTVWIDTTQDVNKSVNDAVVAIVHMMSTRFAKTVIQ